MIGLKQLILQRINVLDFLHILQCQLFVIVCQNLISILELDQFVLQLGNMRFKGHLLSIKL